jgi:CPA2 family monovalent cation:H+ antiporter-2
MTTALTISAALAQIGEFSFILAGLGVALGLMTDEGRDLILAGAILSILLNPLAFWLTERLPPFRQPVPAGAPAEAGASDPVSDLQPTALTAHTILVGFGRVGSLIGAGLRDQGVPLVVIEERPEAVQAGRDIGAEVIVGSAAEARVLAAANLAQARRLLVAIPDAFPAGQIVEQARAANPALDIIARAHSDAEVEHLMRHGASLTIMGEREIARAMLDHVTRSLREPA